MRAAGYLAPGMGLGWHSHPSTILYLEVQTITGKPTGLGPYRYPLNGHMLRTQIRRFIPPTNNNSSHTCLKAGNIADCPHKLKAPPGAQVRMPRQQATWKAAVTRCLLFRDLYIRSAIISVWMSQGRSLRGDVIFLGFVIEKDGNVLTDFGPELKRHIKSGHRGGTVICHPGATRSLTGVICEPVTCTTVHVHTPDLPGNGYSARSKHKRPNFTPITVTDSGEIGPIFHSAVKLTAQQR